MSTLPCTVTSQWYAAYVTARHEKAVSQQLAQRQVESYLPLYSAIHYWNKRRARVELPLFPAYVFVRIALCERVRVLEVPGVVHIVGFGGIPAVVPDAEVEGIRTALRLRDARPCAYLRQGQRVRITDGPLRGLDGIVANCNSETRIVISVDLIQRSVSVQLRPEDLERLS